MLAAPGPSRTARLLALAHYIEAQIEAGVIDDYAQAARSIGLTRARLTQIMNLLLLAPEIQERLLVGDLTASGRALRCVVHETNWTVQAAIIADTARGIRPSTPRTPTTSTAV